MKKLILVLVLVLVPSINLSAQSALQPGIISNSYNNSIVTIGNGSTLALPANASQITWQISYSVAPASVTVLIQTSLDNVNWFVVATSTSVNINGGTIYNSAKFIRCAITASSGGSGITCSFVAKNTTIAISNGNLDNIGSTTVTICGVTPTIIGNNIHGVITIGTGVVTACTLNFSHTLSITPGCVFTPSGLVTVSAVPTASSVVISLSLTLGGGKISYWCFDPTSTF